MWQIISTWICGIITITGVLIFGIILKPNQLKISKKKLIIIMFLISLINSIIYLNFDNMLKTIFMGIVDIVFYKYIFKIKYEKSIFLVLIHVIVLVIVEVLELLFITEVLKLNKDICYSTYAGSIISNVLMYIGFVVVTYLIRKTLRKLINTKIERNTMLIIISILTLICTLMFFYTMIKHFRFSNDIILYLAAMIILLSMLMSLIKQTIENNKLTRKYDKLLEFMTTYENEVEKQRVLRHETKNEFLTIKAKINDKQKNKEIIAYIDEILKEKIIIKQEEYAKFGYLPANGIKGLCYLKTQEAQDKGLNTNINISKRIKKSNIYDLNIKEQRNLGKILGVLLDNAIEASLNSKNKQFGIEVYLNLNKECQIIISNSYDGEINLNKIGKEKFSTKGKNRGHGLLLVKHIIEDNNVFDVKSNITNELYIQIVTINKT